MTIWTAAPHHYYRPHREWSDGVRVFETPSWAPLVSAEDGWGPLDLAWRMAHILLEKMDLCYAFAHPPTVSFPAWICRRLRRRPLLYDWCDWYEGGIIPKREAMRAALSYMALAPRTPVTDIRLDKVFIGSCTNSRIEDLRAAARIVEGRRVADNIKQALVVPGSGLIKRQAEREGLDRVFMDAGFEWREPGCSMCLAMNADRLQPGERCASTSRLSIAWTASASRASHWSPVRPGT